MKIIHALAYYGDYIGGLQRYTREIAIRQKQEGNDVTIYTSELYGNQKKVDGIDIKRVKTPVAFFRVPFTPLMPYNLLKEKCDVLHVHLPLPWLDLSAYIKKLIHRDTKLVITLHNYIPVNSLASRVLSWIHNNLSMKLALTAADLIIVPSREFANSLPYNIPKEKTEVVPCGVDITLFKPSPTNHKNQILFVGRLIPEKGLHVLMEAMNYVRKDIKDARLVAICGEAYDYKGYEQKIKKMDTGFLTLIKNVPNNKMSKFYSKSACFVMPSLDIDSFGIVLLEAMASGCPVVVTDLPGPKALVKKVGGEVVKRNEPKALAKAIVLTIKKGSIYRKMISKKVSKNYSWDKVYSLMDKAYKKI